MKMYRRNASVVLLVVLFTCCGPAAADSGPALARTVTFWHSMSGERYDAFDEIFLTGFADSFPPWTIEDEFPGRAGIALRQRMLGAEGPPDLALVNREDIPYLADAGRIYSMNELLGGDVAVLGLDEELIRWLTYKNKVWGVPLCANTRVMFFNPDLVKAAGLPGPPSTWTELGDFAERATRDTDGDGSTDVWGLHLGDMPVTLRDFYFQAGGRIDLAPDSPEPVTRESVTTAVSMMDDLRYTRELLRAEHRADPLAGGFEQGVVTMEIDRIERAYSIALSGTPYGVAPMPAGMMRATGFSNNRVFVIGRRAYGEPQGALAFTRYFLDPVAHTAWTRISGYVPPAPAIRACRQYRDLAAGWPWIDAAAATIPDVRFVPLRRGSESIEAALSREISRVHERLVNSAKDAAAIVDRTIDAVNASGTPPQRDAAPVRVRFAPSTVKLRTGEDWRRHTSITTKMDMALDETESFQIVVEAPEKQVKVTAVEVTRPISSINRHLSPCRIDVLDMVDIEIDYPLASDRAGPYPDVLVPLQGPVAVAPEKPLRLWVRVRAGENASPGAYKSEIEVMTDDGTVTIAPWTVNVHAVRLPKTPHLSATAGLNFDRLADRFGLDRESAEFRQVADEYYDFLLDYRITPYRPPVKTGRPESQPYLEKDDVTAFVFPYDENDDELQKTAESLRAWNMQDKAYFYVEDEPLHGMYARVIETGLRAAEIAPDFRYMMTTPPTNDFEGLVDIWCLHVGFRPVFTPSSVNEIQKTVWNIEQARNRGEEIWWYTAGAVAPLPTLHIEDDAVAPRVMAWAQPLYGVTGFLHWEMTNWANDDPYTDPYLPPFGNGEGLLVYPPRRESGETGPVPSVRLELLRDGLEDYDLLFMLGRTIDAVNDRFTEISWDYEGVTRMREYAGRFVRKDARERAAREWVFLLAELDRRPDRFAKVRRKLFAEMVSVTEPPVALVATHPPEGWYTTEKTALVEVAAEPRSTIWINGVERRKSQPGYAKARIKLDPGPNRVQVRVERDRRIKTVTRTLYRTGHETVSRKQ